MVINKYIYFTFKALPSQLTLFSTSNSSLVLSLIRQLGVLTTSQKKEKRQVLGLAMVGLGTVSSYFVMVAPLIYVQLGFPLDHGLPVYKLAQVFFGLITPLVLVAFSETVREEFLRLLHLKKGPTAVVSVVPVRSAWN